MSSSITTADNQRAVELMTQAHEAELSSNFKEAYDFHRQASSLLLKVIANGQKKSEERRRAKLNYRAAIDRLNALSACVAGTGPPPPAPLPSLVTFQREMLNPNGVIPLSLIEMGRLSTLPLSQAEGDQSAGFFTPLLSPSLPEVTYHIYEERFLRYPHMWIYFHIKDSTKTQTLYTLSSFKRNKMQVSVCSLARAAEYHSMCAHIIVTPVRPRQFRSEGCMVGRPFSITTSTGTTIKVEPDRLEKMSWTPRRFSYGGRRFVWREMKGSTVEALYEVKKEWADPNSKTGKRLDETFERPLMWGEGKIAMHKICTIHMVGGLDQLFREFLLADLVTQRLIGLFGHG